MSAPENMIPAFYFDPEKLAELAARNREVFKTARPFPHVAIDNFIPEGILARVAEEFPSIESSVWNVYGAGETWNTGNKNIEKVGASDETKFGSLTRHLMHELNSANVLSFLEALSGIKDIVPDPKFSGCGLHSTGRGGRLMIHADSSRHPLPIMDQRLNLILFINRDWKDEYGGHLELWDRSAKRCEKKIAPIFNRCVIFDTGTSSYHGHPHPLTCPENRRRNSLAAYYYVAERERSAEYLGWRSEVEWIATRPEDKRYFSIPKFKSMLRPWIPPICIDAYRKLKAHAAAKGRRYRERRELT